MTLLATMPVNESLEIDVLIIGAGCAGLWLLDDLRRRGYRALAIESRPLGVGQTGLAQGILHSGLKYLFQPGNSAGATPFHEVPALWQQALRGEGQPNLRDVRVRADYCYLWRTDSLRSWLGLTMAKHGLQTRPVPLRQDERPAALATCPGDVFRLDEPVIDTRSLLAAFARRNAGHLWWVSDQAGPKFHKSKSGEVQSVVVASPDGAQRTELRPGRVILAAGEGNAALREAIGLSADVMQRRPLHVAFVMGELPWLNGHCVDGAGTRVTITSDTCADGRIAWQLGGQISEDGVNLSPEQLIERAKSELLAVLPGIRLENCRWRTQRINRAELKTSRAKMPAGAQLLRDGKVLTVWPTKLALAPTLPALVVPHLEAPTSPGDNSIHALHWPAPPLALPAWEEAPPCRRAA